MVVESLLEIFFGVESRGIVVGGNLGTAVGGGEATGTLVVFHVPMAIRLEAKKYKYTTYTTQELKSEYFFPNYWLLSFERRLRESLSGLGRLGGHLAHGLDGRLPRLLDQASPGKQK